MIFGFVKYGLSEKLLFHFLTVFHHHSASHRQLYHKKAVVDFTFESSFTSNEMRMREGDRTEDETYNAFLIHWTTKAPDGIYITSMSCLISLYIGITPRNLNSDIKDLI